MIFNEKKVSWILNQAYKETSETMNFSARKKHCDFKWNKIALQIFGKHLKDFLYSEILFLRIQNRKNDTDDEKYHRLFMALLDYFLDSEVMLVICKEIYVVHLSSIIVE